MEKLIIFAALGYPSSTNPSLPAIPATWDELVESAVAARAAGASIVHFHGPHDEQGKIISDRWGRLAEEIRERCDVLIDFGQAGPPWAERKPLLQLGTGKPDFFAVSLTNHDYRRHHPERGDYDVYYSHSRQELEEYARGCEDYGVKAHWEIWHPGRTLEPGVLGEATAGGQALLAGAVVWYSWGHVVSAYVGRN
jgi:uncharacterized protein (DUF849 family)